MQKLIVGLVVAAMTSAVLGNVAGANGGTNSGLIRNDRLWYDAGGHVINAHGGCVMQDGGLFWWYGAHMIYGKAGNRAHVGVHAYASADLVEWEDRGIALEVLDYDMPSDFISRASSVAPTGDIIDGCVIERPKVLFCAKTRKYVMHFHLELRGQGYEAARVGTAVADRPEGPFAYLGSCRPNGEMSRDMSLFVDDDGSAWQFCSSESNSTVRINRLTDDYVGFTGENYRMAVNDYTEGMAVCKHSGWYFLVGSGCTGWRPNKARLYRSRAISGPWERLGNPCRGVNPQNNLGPDLTWGAQSAYIFRVAGAKDLYVAMFDVWNPKNHEESRYVWLPVMFEGNGLSIDWRTTWSPAEGLRGERVRDN